jgi:hypothetical protein
VGRPSEGRECVGKKFEEEIESRECVCVQKVLVFQYIIDARASWFINGSWQLERTATNREGDATGRTSTMRPSRTQSGGSSSNTSLL